MHSLKDLNKTVPKKSASFFFFIPSNTEQTSYFFLNENGVTKLGMIKISFPTIIYQSSCSFVNKNKNKISFRFSGPTNRSFRKKANMHHHGNVHAKLLVYHNYHKKEVLLKSRRRYENEFSIREIDTKRSD